jgi:Protein of unknown function (DUF1566)
MKTLRSALLMFLVSIFALSFVLAIACGDDDDDESGCDDDDDDTDDDDDDTDDDVDDDYTPVGQCDTQEVYAAMELLTDCYIFEDADGNQMDAEMACEFTAADTIDCFMDCYDSFDECGGDVDPMFDCLMDCFNGDPDDDVDDDVDDDADDDVWEDSTSGLMWQNPPLGEYTLWDDAIEYCESLELDGHDDWHLPTISELRSLIRGCDGTVSGGSCGVTDGCLDHQTCWNDNCGGCDFMEGPGIYGAYSPDGVSNALYWYWSSSMAADPVYGAWLVSFSEGFIINHLGSNTYDVRCVRP